MRKFWSVKTLILDAEIKEKLLKDLCGNENFMLASGSRRICHSHLKELNHVM